MVKSVVPLIIDRQICTGADSAPACLLTMPLGRISVLHSLAGRLSELGSPEVLVMPSFDPPKGYERRLAASTSMAVRVVPGHQTDEILSTLEIGDTLLVVDPRYWPVDGHDFCALRDRWDGYRGATHVIAVTAGCEDVRERIECAPNGSVRRIERIYSTVQWPETAEEAIVCTIAPARCMAGMRFRTLPELRAGLLAGGGLNRDLPLDTNVLDLGGPQGLLALTDHVLARANGDQSDPRFRVHAVGVLVGNNCRIHPTVRIVPPVVIHEGAVIDRDVVIVGPSVIGPNARIRRSATIAQCLLDSDTEIRPGAVVRHRLCCGRGVGDDITTTGSVIPVTSLPSESQWAREMERLAGRGADSRRRIYPAVKRVMDVVSALLALAVLAVPMLLVAIITKLDSAGPVFFKHRREGKDGKEFSCLKFRTMTVDAHKLQRQLYRNNEVDGPQFKLRQDPRVTRVGRLLRVTNFDETPQLLNVLAGHMSLVGPRPSPFRENQICVPWRRARLSVRPGITGLWQVCRDENRTQGDFHEWIFYDVNYVRHLSLGLDLKILVATAFALVGWRQPVKYLLPASRWTNSIRPMRGYGARRWGLSI